MKKLIWVFVFLVFFGIIGYKLSNKPEPQKINKLERIKALTEQSLSSSGYQDEKTTSDTRKEICELTARDETERNKAVEFIKTFR